jgi:hypothetical protein
MARKETRQMWYNNSEPVRRGGQQRVILDDSENRGCNEGNVLCRSCS